MIRPEIQKSPAVIYLARTWLLLLLLTASVPMRADKVCPKDGKHYPDSVTACPLDGELLKPARTKPKPIVKMVSVPIKVNRPGDKGKGKIQYKQVKTIVEPPPMVKPSVAALPFIPSDRPVMINPKDGAEMVWIPAGEFWMGSSAQEVDRLLKLNGKEYKVLFGAEAPQRKVYLDGYWIYKNLVTVKQYKKFCEAKERPMPPYPFFNKEWEKEDHPMVNVSWDDAKAYCEWAGVDLPTEAQWEKAARGTDARLFPWGNQFDAAKCQSSRQDYADARSTAPVGSHPNGRSPYGVNDMAGNVWQWCLDWYDRDFYKTGPARNPTGPPNGDFHDLRGGSWFDCQADDFRVAFRDGNVADFKDNDVGFRGAVLEIR